MNRFFSIALMFCLCFAVFGCRITAVPESDPMQVLPTVGDDETDAKVYEVKTPEPLIRGKETVYPLYYGGAVVTTKDKAEWESWLQDPSLAPLPALHDDRSFVLTWCHQFAQYEPEEVGLILMNYFEYDHTFSHMQPTWHYRAYPQVAFVDWHQLRRAIVDKTLVCAGYAQLFYFIVKEKYPGVRYITSNQINHARNSFEGDQWDLTWLDDEGVDYNPDKIKLDFVGMQKRIAQGDRYYMKRKHNIDSPVSDWKIVNLSEGERPW